MAMKKFFMLSMFGLVAGTLVKTSEAATYYQAVYGKDSGGYSYDTRCWKNLADGSPCAEILETDDFITRTTGASRLYLCGNDHRVFGGNSLSIGTGTEEGIAYQQATSGTITFPRVGLILKQGALDITQVNSGREVTISGNVMVDQPAGAKSFGIVVCQRGKLHFTGGTFSSTENSVLELTKCYRYVSGTSGNDRIAGLDVGYLNNGEQSLSNNLVTIAASCDCSEFRGTLVVTNKMATFVFDGNGKRALWGTELQFGGEKTLPGTVKVNSGCALSLDDSRSTLAVGSLVLADDAMLIVPPPTATDRDERGFMTNVIGGVTAVFSATDSLTVAGKVKIDLSGTELVPNGETNVHQILSFPAGSDVSIDDFEVVGFVSKRIETRLSIEDVAPGRQALCLVVEPFQRIAVSDPETGVTDTSDNQVYMSALTNAASWSDGRLPRAGVTSLVVPLPNSPSSFVILRTPDGRKNSKYVLTFPGKRLVVGGKAKFYMNCGEFVSTDQPLRLLDGAQLKAPNIVGAFKLTGGVEIGAGLVQMMPYPTTTITIDKVTGTGEFSIGATDFTWANCGKHHFLDTSEFYGTITCVQPRWGYTKWGDLNPETGLPQYYQNIYIHNNALGGRLETFDYKALRVGTWTHLWVPADDNEAALTNGLNRGLMVDGYVYAFVEPKKRMRIDWPITMNGVLVKDSGGTLALGGDRTLFGPEGSEQPQAALTNDFQIRYGTLELRSANAVNGMTLSVSNGVSIKVVYGAGDADMLRYGVRTDKTAEPFVLAEGLDGKLPIAFDFSGVSGFTGETIGLVTVKNDPAVVSAVAAMLPAKVPVRIDGKKRKGVVRRVTSQDGTQVTFAADATVSGLMMVVH